MSSDTAAVDLKVSKTKKTLKSTSIAKPRKDVDHPSYKEMVEAAIVGLKERDGSSKHAVVKFITSNYGILEDKKLNALVRGAINKGVASGSLKQITGTGAIGSFKVANKSASIKKAPVNKKTVVKDAKVEKKPYTPKKAEAAQKPKKTSAVKMASPARRTVQSKKAMADPKPKKTSAVKMASPAKRAIPSKKTVSVKPKAVAKKPTKQ